MEIIKERRGGILLPDLKIGFDCSGSQADFIFISHAHSDHTPAGKELPLFATKHTISFMKARGYRGKVSPVGFGEPVSAGDAVVTLLPAGHILGSAMVYVESDLGTLLYTGDCRTPPSPASEGFKLPDEVDYLITEATFSLPIYRWPPMDELATEIRIFAEDSIEQGHTPLFLAYNLGKAQEIMHLLAPLGRTVQIHGDGYRLCRIYEEAGVDLGNYEPYDPESCEGKILVAPASALRNGMARMVKHLKTAYCSGWAVRESIRGNLNADKLIPLSDHLDFFELIALCKKLHPDKVFITHTPTASVVQHYLDNLAIESVFLDKKTPPGV